MFIKYVIFFVEIIYMCFASKTGKLPATEAVSNFIIDKFTKNISPNDSACACDIKYTVNAAVKEELWALNMLDASSKFPSGILSGNTVDLGAFDQCLAVRNNRTNSSITGKYCTVSVTFNKIIDVIKSLSNHSEFNNKTEETNRTLNEYPVSLALCIPNSCDVSVLNVIFKNTTFLKKFEIIVTSCQTKVKEEFKTCDWIALTFFVFIGTSVISCTIYDLILQYNNLESVHRILLAFSLFTNGRKLFTINENPNQLNCLNGIRVISMLWLVILHTYYKSFITPVVNRIDIWQWMMKISSMYILGSTVSVDTFFLLSGLLMSYTYLCNVAKGIKFNVFNYYIHRYIRLTPSLAAMILFHVTLLRYIGTGPNLPGVVTSLRSPCTKYWWSSLLYVQNYVNPRDLCLLQTWYLSVDVQLYLLSPLVLISMSRWPKRTMQFLSVLVIISVLITLTGALLESWPADMPLHTKVLTYMDHHYIGTHSRFGPTIVGIMLGYFIFNRSGNSKLNSILNNNLLKYGSWAVALAVLVMIVFLPNNMFWHKYNHVEFSIYAGVHRVVWSVIVSWIIYICIQGHGGAINSFLSLPAFQIFSRLTYSMFLIHFSFQSMKIGFIRVPIHFSDFQNMYNFWGDCMLTLIMAIIWTLAVEYPMYIIEEVIFKTTNPKIRAPDSTVIFT